MSVSAAEIDFGRACGHAPRPVLAPVRPSAVERCPWLVSCCHPVITKRPAEDSGWPIIAGERSPGPALDTIPSGRRRDRDPDPTAPEPRPDRRPGDHANQKHATFRCAVRRRSPPRRVHHAGVGHRRRRGLVQLPAASSSTADDSRNTRGMRPQPWRQPRSRAAAPVAADNPPGASPDSPRLRCRPCIPPAGLATLREAATAFPAALHAAIRAGCPG